MNLRTIACIILLLTCCSAPALGATKYTEGSPVLSAEISGTNEFTQGEDVTLTIVLQNSGLNNFKFVNSGSIERDELPNTAKLVTVWLEPGTAPVTVRTDPQMVGDIKGSGIVTLRVSAKISNNATAGEYVLPLTIRYRYLASTEQEASDTMQFLYREVNQVSPLAITIRPQVKIEVLEAVPETLNVGTEGFLTLRIRNTGSENGKKATVKILRNGASPVIPTDSSVFVGDFPSGGIIACRYKVAVSSNAEKQTYPVDVAVTYENDEGEIITSEPFTIGIPVGGRTAFIIVSAPPALTAGSQGIISVDYQNTGTATVYKAQARISAVDPFISNDNTAYLGDLKPGETATARYGMGVNSEALYGEYVLDSEVRFQDALDNSQVSDMVKVPVLVGARSGAGNPVSDPLVAFLVLAVITGAGYYVLVMRNKK